MKKFRNHLMVAALFGVLAAIGTVMNSRQASAQNPNSGGAPVISEALRRGDMATVRTAMNSGADVNSRDADGNTLLMQAAVYASAADLEFLLAHGAVAEDVTRIVGGYRPRARVDVPDEGLSLPVFS